MTDTIDILIRSIFDAKGTADAQRAIAALGAASKAGNSAAAPIAATGTAAAKSEKQILSLASAQARLQATQGDLAGAANTLSTAIAKVDQSSIAAIRTQTQLAQVQNKLSGQSQSLTSLFKNQNQVLAGLSQQMAGLGQQLSGLGGNVGNLAGSFGQLAGSLGKIGSIGAIIGIAKVGADMAQAGGAVQTIKQSFDNLAISANTTGDALLSKMHAAAQGTISDAKLMESANSGLLLTNGKIATDLPRLLEIARAAAKATGEDVGFLFDSLVKGIARGSPMIIDNAKITLDAAGAFETYAKSIGKAPDQLTRAEQQQATLNAVLAAGGDIITKVGGDAESNSQKFARMGTVLENAKNRGAAALADSFGPLVGAMADAATAADGTSASFEHGAAGAATLIQSLLQMKTASEAQRQANDDMAGSVVRGADAVLTFLGITQQAAPTIMQAADAQDRGAAAAIIHATALNTLTMDEERHTAAVTSAISMAEQQASVTQQAADASLIDATAKQAQAAQTELLQFQTKQAADAFLALNPNISGSGIASAVAAGQISAAVGQYIAMTLAAANARAQLAALQAQAGISPALKAAATAAGGGDVGRYITRPADPRAKEEGEAAVKRLRELNAQEKAHDDAVRNSTMTNGTATEKQKLLNKEYQDAARIYGQNSTQAINAKTALDQLVASQEKGHKKRADAAQQGADRLASIEQSTGNKLEDIDRSTQDKLIEIDKKAAEARAAAARKLQEMLATSGADRRVQNEIDDLELIGVKDKKQAAALNDREKAEADARKREQTAAAEARATSEAGEAETAGKIYDIREKQIDAQQSLDEKYYEKQRELSGNKDALAALQTQYEEGTRAIGEAADVRIGIAQAEAEQARQAFEDEKAAVIAAAEDQKNHVIDRAQQSAEGVKKASGEARAKAVSDLQAIGSAVTAIPTSKTITITTVQQTVGGSSGGGAAGQNRAAGGGTFLTSKPTTLTVGDNPGGVEMVTVTPLSGRGTSSASGNLIRMAGGGTVVIDAGSGYTTPIAGSGKGGGGGGGGGVAAGPKPVDVTAATKQLNEQIAFLKATAELAYLLKSPIPAIDTKALQDLANESKRMGAVVGSQLVPISKDNMKMLDDYDRAVSSSIGILTDVQSARKDLAEPQPPIDAAYIRQLAQETKTIGGAIGALLVPVSQTALMELEDYEKAVSSSVSILKNVQDLRKDLAEPQSPIDPVMLYKMAIDAQRASVVIRSLLIPYSEDEADQMSRYADAVGSSVSVFKDVSELSSKMFTDYQSPTDTQIGMLAKDAERVTRAMASAATTFDTKGLEAAKLYNEAVGGTFANIKDGLLAMQALSSGDFVLDAGKLAQFEQGSLQMLDVTKRLGAIASTIPAADIAALQAVTAAQTAQFESTIKMAAVPFGDLAGASVGYAQSGGTLGKTGNTTINNTFVLPPGSNQQIAYEVIKILNAQTGSRR